MATLTDGFEDLGLGTYKNIDRPHFALEVPSNTLTQLQAVKDPLAEISKGTWVKYKWGSHFGENDTLTMTLKGGDVRSVSFVNYRSTAGDPCQFFDADGTLLGSAKLPAKSLVPVVCASSTAPIKTIKVSIAGGPGVFIAFDNVVIETD